MEISIVRFCLGLLLVALPLYVLHVFDTGLLRRALVALARMAAVLLVLGACLYFVFRVDHWALNVAMALLLVAVGALASAGVARLSVRRFFVPVAAGMLLSTLVVGMWLLLVAFGPENPLQTRWLVPLTGLLVGAMVKPNADALSTYYMGLRHHGQLYYHLTGNGASPGRALAWFARRALQRVALPALGRMAGLMVVASPVTTWAMLLSGESVAVAIGVQTLLLVAGFSASVASLVVTLYVARRFSFDEYGRLLDFTKADRQVDGETQTH